MNCHRTLAERFDGLQATHMVKMGMRYHNQPYPVRQDPVSLEMMEKGLPLVWTSGIDQDIACSGFDQIGMTEAESNLAVFSLWGVDW
jgi:hypothetical protein